MGKVKFYNNDGTYTIYESEEEARKAHPNSRFLTEEESKLEDERNLKENQGALGFTVEGVRTSNTTKSVPDHNLNLFGMNGSGVDRYRGSFRPTPKWDWNFAGNHNRAVRNNPEFEETWDSWRNIWGFVDTNTYHLFNRFSPTLNIRLIYDAVNGKNIINSWIGNNGIVPDKIALERPDLAIGANLLGDFSIYKLPWAVRYLGKLNKWEPLDGGAEFDVYKRKYVSPTVEKRGATSLTYINLRNQVPGAVPLLYKGIGPDGIPRYRLPKLEIANTLSEWEKAIELFNKNILKSKVWKRLNFPDAGDYVYTDGKNLLLDLELGNLTKNGKAIDFSIIPLTDAYATFYKKGGKLWEKKGRTLQ